MTQHKSKNGNNLLGNSFQFVSGEADLVVMGGAATDTHSHTLLLHSITIHCIVDSLHWPHAIPIALH